MGAVAEAMLQRLEDEVALDIGDGAADEALPGTGGGGIAMMKASSIACSLPKSWPMMADAGCLFLIRSSKGLKRAKMAPALEALARVAPEKPAKATV